MGRKAIWLFGTALVLAIYSAPAAAQVSVGIGVGTPHVGASVVFGGPVYGVYPYGPAAPYPYPYPYPYYAPPYYNYPYAVPYGPAYYRGYQGYYRGGALRRGAYATIAARPIAARATTTAGRLATMGVDPATPTAGRFPAEAVLMQRALPFEAAVAGTVAARGKAHFRAAFISV